MGIEAFKLDRTASNTLQSHRLVQWAARNHSLEHSEALYGECDTCSSVTLVALRLPEPNSNSNSNQNQAQLKTKTQQPNPKTPKPPGPPLPQDLLNVRHFVEGRKLNDRSMLLEAAAEVGLDTDLAAAMLETDGEA